MASSPSAAFLLAEVYAGQLGHPLLSATVQGDPSSDGERADAHDLSWPSVFHFKGLRVVGYGGNPSSNTMEPAFDLEAIDAALEAQSSLTAGQSDQRIPLENLRIPGGNALSIQSHQSCFVAHAHDVDHVLQLCVASYRVSCTFLSSEILQNLSK